MPQQVIQQWLVKSEAQVYSIDDLKRDKRTLWDGVRNYQARNFLLEMQVGDAVLFYHSSSEPSGIVGLARCKKAAEPDELQFDHKSEYFDAKATRDKPRWYAPTIEFVSLFRKPLLLADIKSHLALQEMPLLQRGSRLSVHPVTDAQFKVIMAVTEASEK